jgi:hypothetical protein
MNACNLQDDHRQESGVAGTERGSEPLLPGNAPTETLLKTLAGYNGAFERIDAAMLDIVAILREREASWAMIGQALAVSRQAAWKRFGSMGPYRPRHALRPSRRWQSL